ncbi:MAG: hypothetical protein ABL888_22560, partial [Pirellulaceae bacterium]
LISLQDHPVLGISRRREQPNGQGQKVQTEKDGAGHRSFLREKEVFRVQLICNQTPSVTSAVVKQDEAIGSIKEILRLHES